MNVRPERSDVDRLRRLAVIVRTVREKIGVGENPVIVIDPDMACGPDGTAVFIEVVHLPSRAHNIEPHRRRDRSGGVKSAENRGLQHRPASIGPPLCAGRWKHRVISAKSKQLFACRAAPDAVEKETLTIMSGALRVPICRLLPSAGP